jgi:hypothetical protein
VDVVVVPSVISSTIPDAGTRGYISLQCGSTLQKQLGETVQSIEIDFDALDASYILGTEFCFWASLSDIDPFQPLTLKERNEIIDTRYGGHDGCGTLMPLSRVADRIDEYWTADD